MKEMLIIISIFTVPWTMLFTHKAIDIWAECIKMKLNCSKHVHISTILFVEIERKSKDLALIGNNMDVLKLLFSRRFLYEGLKICTFLAGLSSIFIILILYSSSAPEETNFFQRVFTSASGDISNGAIWAGCIAVWYYLSILLALVVKRQIEKEIIRLAHE